MELGAVGSGEPHVFWGKCAWMPVAFEAAGIIGKENHAALKEAHDHQQKHVCHQKIEQKHRCQIAQMPYSLPGRFHPSPLLRWVV